MCCLQRGEYSYQLPFFFVTECFVLAGPLCCCLAKITTGALKVVKRAASLWIPRAAAQINLEAQSAWILKEKLPYQSQRHLHSQPVTRSAWTECHHSALWCQWNATELALEKQMRSYTNTGSCTPLGNSRLAAVSQVQVLIRQLYRVEDGCLRNLDSAGGFQVNRPP